MNDSVSFVGVLSFSSVVLIVIIRNFFLESNDFGDLDPFVDVPFLFF